MARQRLNVYSEFEQSLHNTLLYMLVLVNKFTHGKRTVMICPIGLTRILYTVHDTENLTFSEEFRGCSASARVELPRGRTRIFRAGGRGSSAQTGTSLPCGFGLKMAETRRRTSCATTLND